MGLVIASNLLYLEQLILCYDCSIIRKIAVVPGHAGGLYNGLDKRERVRQEGGREPRLVWGTDSPPPSVPLESGLSSPAPHHKQHPAP